MAWFITTVCSVRLRLGHKIKGFVPFGAAEVPPISERGTSRATNCAWCQRVRHVSSASITLLSEVSGRIALWGENTVEGLSHKVAVRGNVSATLMQTRGTQQCVMATGTAIHSLYKRGTRPTFDQDPPPPSWTVLLSGFWCLWPVASAAEPSQAVTFHRPSDC